MDINVVTIEQALKVIVSNPWLLTFAILWVFGWYLKEHTKLNNKLIPTFILAGGLLLGLVIIERGVVGGALGILMGYLIIAFYEHIKNTIQFLALKKK